jgi:hypothetical protein
MPSKVVLACIGTLIASIAGASELAFDTFARSFPIYASGGVGFAGPWMSGAWEGGSHLPNYSASDRSLCYRDLPSHGGSISGMVETAALDGIHRVLTTPLGAEGTTAYVSFLLRPAGKLGVGYFDGYFGLTVNGTGTSVFIGKPGAGAENQYVIETAGGAGQVPSGVPVVVGKTALLVVKAQFLAGNDALSLYVNPKPGAPEPAAAPVKSDADLGTVTSIGIYSTGSFTIDEIKVGTAYADVVSAGPGATFDDFLECVLDDF